MKESSFALIKMLFQWINPFLMCVFSEAAEISSSSSSSLSAPAASLSYLSSSSRSALSPWSLSCIM